MLRATRTAGALLAVSVIYGLADAQTGTITDGQTILGYTTTPASGLILTQAGDTATPSAFTFDAIDVWQIDLRDPVTGNTVNVTPSAATFSYSFTSTSSSFTATWDDVDSSSLPSGETFDVTVTAQAADNAIELTIDVDAANTTSAIEAVLFPREQFLERGDAEHGVLTYPYVGGWLLNDPGQQRRVQRNPVADEPGRVEHAVLLVLRQQRDEPCEPVPRGHGTRTDTSSRCGRFGRAWIRPDALRMELRQVPEDNLAAQSYASPYPAVIAGARGDWYDAARAYRNWAVNQPWTAKGRMTDNEDFSDIVRDAQMFAPFMVDHCCPVPEPPAQYPEPYPCPCDWNYSNYQYLTADLVEQRTLFGVTEMVGHYYNWDQHSFEGGNWGEWLPARFMYRTYAPQAGAQGDDHASYFLPNLYSKSAPRLQRARTCPATAASRSRPSRFSTRTAT